MAERGRSAGHRVAYDLFARGIVTSTTGLTHKIRRCIDRYNRAAKGERWTYRYSTRRIA